MFANFVPEMGRIRAFVIICAGVTPVTYPGAKSAYVSVNIIVQQFPGHPTPVNPKGR